MVYNGEAHQGTHEPIITKKLYDRVQKIMKSKSRPRQQNNSSRFPFSGLAHCHNCGCAITAERQKGHHYYRCTKKAGPCDERYVREEILADQISQAISSVALPQSSFDYLSKKMNAFEQRASQEIAQQKNQIEQRISEANEKIDRLLDAHLDGLVTKSEYQTKKAKLVDEKVTQEEKLGEINKGAIAWLEPCSNFLKAAHQAHQLATSENLESQKIFLKKTGSNHILAARRLSFSWKGPWALLAGKTPFYGHLRPLNGRSSRDYLEKNRRQLESPSETYVKLRRG